MTLKMQRQRKIAGEVVSLVGVKTGDEKKSRTPNGGALFR
jgi:hypothetical protein